MEDETYQLESIRQNAEAFLAFTRDRLGVDLSFDQSGVAWMADFIERRRPGLTPGQADELVLTAGAYLGECLCRTYGGSWVKVEGRWGVRFASGATAFPFTKARKHIEAGPADSVMSLFQVVPEFLGEGGVPPNLALQRTRPDSASPRSDEGGSGGPVR
jgi:hypothetical protein